MKKILSISLIIFCLTLAVCANASGGIQIFEWLTNSTYITPADTSKDVAIGGTTSANSDFFVDVSANTAYINNNLEIAGDLTIRNNIILEGFVTTSLSVATSSNTDIHFPYDANTGIDWVSADSLALRTGGTNRLTLSDATSIFSNSLRASSTLMVTGATTLHSTLNVTGLTTLVNASTTLLSVSGTEYIGGANGLVLSDGSILDASGAISFGNENLTTTGTFSGLDLTATSGFRIGEGSSGGHITALGDDTLFVEGQSEFDGTSWFDGSLRASSTLLVTGNTTLYGNLNIGSIEWEEDSGQVNALDKTIASAAATDESYNFALDSNKLLTIYGEGDGGAGVQNMRIWGNRDNADIDFRLDGDTNDYVFFVDAGNERVSIGTSTPVTNFAIYNGTATTTMQLKSGGASKGGRFILEDSDAAGCTECYALNGTLTCAVITCP